MMEQIIFVYAIPSAFTVLLMAVLIVWIVSPPSAKILIKKKLGFMKGKTLNLVADNDYQMWLEADDVAPEGLLEKRRRKKLSRYFYLAKPGEETANKEENEILRKVDVDRCPPYNFDGIPTFCSHIAEAYATNPRVILSLQMADKMDQDNPRKTTRELVLGRYFKQVGTKIVQTIPIKVLLGWDPVALAKVGLKVNPTRINQTQRRYEERGAIKSKALGNDMLKIMIIGAIVACAMIAGVVIAGKVFG